MKKVKIYLKSGHLLEINTSNIQWTRDFNKVVSIRWEQDDPSIIEELKYLDPEQIEAITIKEIKEHPPLKVESKAI